MDGRMVWMFSSGWVECIVDLWRASPSDLSWGERLGEVRAWLGVPLSMREVMYLLRVLGQMVLLVFSALRGG